MGELLCIAELSDLTFFVTAKMEEVCPIKASTTKLAKLLRECIYVKLLTF